MRGDKGPAIIPRIPAPHTVTDSMGGHGQIAAVHQMNEVRRDLGGDHYLRIIHQLVRVRFVNGAVEGRLVHLHGHGRPISEESVIAGCTQRGRLRVAVSAQCEGGRHHRCVGGVLGVALQEVQPPAVNGQAQHGQQGDHAKGHQDDHLSRLGIPAGETPQNRMVDMQSDVHVRYLVRSDARYLSIMGCDKCLMEPQSRPIRATLQVLRLAAPGSANHLRRAL